ncbi:MAG TPA: type I-C CRISPR-associated protein Cas8c/Csd1, partial [Bryobacteraceae bacterium]|nr:type I-C CRISPR-associated protein Cas8c/Csd1 [Bryobacteraceae bacterium]
MSWIQKLHETYEACVGAQQFAREPLLPVSHTEQQAHIEIVLDPTGLFLRAETIRKESTVVPATEESAGRTGKKPPPHPLCDKIQYCAGDYAAFGGLNEPFFEPYLAQLRLWQAEEPNSKVQAVLNYVEKKHVVADLLGAGLMYCGPGRILLTAWDPATPAPELFKMLTPKPKDKRRDQGDAFVRWRVQVPGDPVSALWEDPDVRNSWIRFLASRKANLGLCMVTGKRSVLAASHPKRMRHGADGAKLISSNDATGFTFRGRVSTPEQAYGVGSVATQKVHAALRWLISRQGYHDKASGQVFVAWSVNGTKIPDPFLDTAHLFGDVPPEGNSTAASYQGDGGQHFALRLRHALAGYRARLSDSDGVVVMGLDSATPGRMAITYYRELSGSEFLDRVAGWHSEYAWPQNYSRDNQFVGAPAPREIAETAYGHRLDDALRKATVERLLPSIIDARALPPDILRTVVRRVANRNGLEKWEWEKCLGIACALVRGSRKDENYDMSLEQSRTTRDYLFGRLLAIADNIEDRAQHLAKEKRDTNAAKLMQRFADHPCSTWRTLELAITPYKARLRANRPSVLLEREKLLDT